MSDDGDAYDAFGDRLATQPHLLQVTPRTLINRYLPVAIWQPSRRLAHIELYRNQGAALLANFNIGHQSRQSLAPAGAGRGATWPGPGKIRQLNRINEVGELIDAITVLIAWFFTLPGLVLDPVEGFRSNSCKSALRLYYWAATL